MKRLALAFALFATPAAAQQFDLVCTGQLTTGIDSAPAPSDRHYRIDLDHNRWCLGDCKRPQAIQEVTADLIVLEKKQPTAPLWARIDHAISRVTGEVSSFWIADALYEKYVGKCTSSAFSGMPTQLF